MTTKIIEVDGKFGVKELSDDGGSLGVRAERFNTEAEAQGFADSLERGVSPDEAAEQQPAPETKEPEDEVTGDQAPVEGGSENSNDEQGNQA